MINLTKKQAKQYKEKWRRVEAAQVREWRTTPVSLKFKQLCLLMNVFRPGRPDKTREKEVDTTRKRWRTLKAHGKQKP